MVLGLGLGLQYVGGGDGGSSPPTNITPPSIAGISPYYVGSTVTGTGGTYSGSPTVTRKYQYDIGSGWVDSSTTTLTAIILNEWQGTGTAPKIRMLETATNAGGSINTPSNELNIFNPRTSIANDVLWLDAADPSTITQVAGSVSQWSDKSGSSNNATQGTGAQQPVTGTRTINSRNTIFFDGTDDGLILPSSLYSIALGANTQIVVYQSDNMGASTQRVLSGQVGGLLRYGIYFTATLFRSIHATTASPIDISAARDTVPHVGGFTRNGINVSPYYDGVAGTPGTNGADLILTSMNIGDGVTSGAAPLFGVVAEMLIYNRELSTSELNLLGNYLKSKWGVTWTGL